MCAERERDREMLSTKSTKGGTLTHGTGSVYVDDLLSALNFVSLCVTRFAVSFAHRTIRHTSLTYTHHSHI